MGIERDAGPRIVVARSPTTTLTEENQRHSEAVCQFEHPVLFVVVTASLRPGQDRVVVVDKSRPRPIVIHEVSVDRTGASDEAIRWGLPTKRLHVVALVLSSHDQGPILFERSGVDQLRDVLAGHAIAPRPPFRHSLGPVLVERMRVPIEGFLEVRTDVVEVGLFLRTDGTAGHIRLFYEDDRVAFTYHVAHRHRDLADDATTVRCNHVLHLHCLDDGHLLALTHLVAHGDIDGDDGSLDGRGETK